MTNFGLSSLVVYGKPQASVPGFACSSPSSENADMEDENNGPNWFDRYRFP